MGFTTVHRNEEALVKKHFGHYTGRSETVMMQGGSLLWCAHHFAFFEDALNAFGATILVDERRR
jgi:hypothetical protein